MRGVVLLAAYAGRYTRFGRGSMPWGGSEEPRALWGLRQQDPERGLTPERAVRALAGRDLTLQLACGLATPRRPLPFRLCLDA